MKRRWVLIRSCLLQLMVLYVAEGGREGVAGDAVGKKSFYQISVVWFSFLYSGGTWGETSCPGEPRGVAVAPRTQAEVLTSFYCGWWYQRCAGGWPDGSAIFTFQCFVLGNFLLITTGGEVLFWESSCWLFWKSSFWLFWDSSCWLFWESSCWLFWETSCWVPQEGRFTYWEQLFVLLFVGSNGVSLLLARAWGS